MVFSLSGSLRPRRLCVWFFNAEVAEAAELRRELDSGAPWLGRPSRRVRRSWPEIFEWMNLGLPNQIKIGRAHV